MMLVKAPEFLSTITLLLLFAPLVAAGSHYQFANKCHKKLLDFMTVSALTITFGLSSYILWGFLLQHWPIFTSNLYCWGQIAKANIYCGLLLDPLTAILLTMVSSIALIVHIYSISYMATEPRYSDFFSYLLFFTFAMLFLVIANNFLQLFFAWELVGVASYLLIGFWHTKNLATTASFKALLINRIGDVGLLLGILWLFSYCHTFNYQEIFLILAKNNNLPTLPITAISLLLLIGAISKSAQIPLHTWLPDSMAGPVPVSALIHAATMVAAGVFMLARIMPVLIYSPITITTMIWLGSITYVVMGLKALVQYELKQILAYATISQLGLMFVALGVTATKVAITHLVNHAFIKALLFLAIGIIIVIYHKQQDLKIMGQMRNRIPLLYYVLLIASLAAIGVPGFAGYFTKEAILIASKNINVNLYYLLECGTFITSLYIMRMFMVIFYGRKSKVAILLDNKILKSWLIKISLIALTIPIVMLGWFNDEVWLTIFYAGKSLTFWLSMMALVISYVYYQKNNIVPKLVQKYLILLPSKLIFKNWGDLLNGSIIFASKMLAKFCWQLIEQLAIEQLIVQGSAIIIHKTSLMIRKLQSGYLIHYLVIMFFGLLILWYTLVI